MNCLETIVLVLLSLQTAPYGTLFLVKLKGQKIISFVLRLIWIIRMISDCIRHYNIIKLDQLPTLSIVVMIVHVFSSIITGYVLAYRSNYYKMLIMNKIHYLSKRTKICLIFTFISFEMYKLYIGYSQIHSKYISDELLIKLIDIFTRFTSFYDTWVMNGLSIYVTIFLLNHCNKMNMIKRIKSKYNYYDWLKILVTVDHDHSQFEKNLSILPSIWLLYSFLGSAGLIEIWQKYLSFRMMILEILAVLPWVSTIVLVNNLQDDFSSYVKNLKFTVYSCQSVTSGSKQAIGGLMNSLVKYKVTAYSFLYLDRSLFLPYLGSVFTYTILLQDKFSHTPSSLSKGLQ